MTDFYITKGDAENEVEICLEYTITDISPATLMGPEEGGEVEIFKAYYMHDMSPYTMTEKEVEDWSLLIFENHDFDDGYEDWIAEKEWESRNDQ